MENELFLKKFKGSCELLGKEGPIGILNHLHNNITGFKPKKVRIKKQEKKIEMKRKIIYLIIIKILAILMLLTALIKKF